MATTEDDGDIGAEVSSRLDELFPEEEDEEVDAPGSGFAFGEEERGGEETSWGATGDSLSYGESAGDITTEYSPLDKLKATVSEIEWEITDETMEGFLHEVTALKEKYGEDVILLMFLRIHESIGKYIRARKARAHPDAITFVSSVFTAFEKAVSTPELSRKQKKELLIPEIKAFKELKANLQRRKHTGRTSAASSWGSDTGGPFPGGPLRLENREAIDYLADYIVQRVRKAIREEVEKIVRAGNRIDS